MAAAEHLHMASRVLGSESANRTCRKAGVLHPERLPLSSPLFDNQQAH